MAWDYRRYVLASLPVKRPESDELAYTTRKIEANFSNFSAWHQRSKVYMSMWEKGLLDEAKTKDAGNPLLVYYFRVYRVLPVRIRLGEASFIRRPI